jgi:hypothetical protein
MPEECSNGPILCPGTKAAFCSVDRFVAETAISRMVEGGARSEGHIRMNGTKIQHGHCWGSNLGCPPMSG